MKVRVFSTLVIAHLLISSSSAWHPQIHSIIGYIAQANLSSKHDDVLQKVLKSLSTLSSFFSESPNSLMEAAAMPNEISDAYFGFLDRTRFSEKPIVYWKDRESDLDLPTPPFSYNITFAMNQTQQIIRRSLQPVDSDPQPVKPGLIDSLMMRYLLNLAGNLHNPVDNASFFSKSILGGKLVNGDQNGSKIPVQTVLGKQMGNLNSLYNRAFGALELREMKYPFDPDMRQLVSAQGEYLMTKYPEAHFEDELTKLNHIDWNEESYSIASEFTYSQVELFPILNPEYIISGRRICEERITLAGYRLYRLLVQLFKPGNRSGSVLG